jgi:UDP-N-acetylmuramate dehydrogenase
VNDWRAAPVRGRLLFGETLAPFTWLRVGGPADALFLPADAEDLADFLKGLPPEVPVTPLGVGSNLIIRDGGVEGVVVRLAGRAFSAIEIQGDQISAGAGALDAMVAREAARAGMAGLEFLAGIPGAIGGALVMNAGCYGREIKDILIAAQGVDRSGAPVRWTKADFGYAYRTSRAGPDIIWLKAEFAGTPDAPAAIQGRIAEITARRETSQPIREKTGGSTFKNTPGRSAWELVDAAGYRGKLHGGAMFSPQHANFLINTGTATAADLEALGEEVRRVVRETQGCELNWEIKRIGRHA